MRLKHKKKRKDVSVIMQEKGKLTSNILIGLIIAFTCRTRVKDMNKAFKELERLCRTHFPSNKAQTKVCTLFAWYRNFDNYSHSYPFCAKLYQLLPVLRNN